MLGRLINQTLDVEPADYVWGDTLPVLSQSDARIGNLECVISDIGAPWSVTPKTFHFRTDSRNIKTLEVAGINAVSLANNHALDFDYEALVDMLDTLDEAEIHYAGAGNNFLEASRPAVLDIKGCLTGFIACTDNQPEWEAAGPGPGIFYLPIDGEDNRAKYLLSLVKETKLKVDLVIVSIHWGPNWGYRPPQEHLSFARDMVDNGADIVFGHSPHVFRGIEIYRRRPIIYSAGDFIDDYAVDETQRNDESFIFTLETRDGRPGRLCLTPTIIQNFQARLVRYGRSNEIGRKMQELCLELGTESEWNEKEECLEILIHDQ